MRKIFALFLLCVSSWAVQAQNLTPAQILTVRAAIFADQTAAPLLAAGNVSGLQTWLNAGTATRGWLSNASPSLLDEAPTYTTYDTLIQGKRDSWVRLLAAARDFTKAKIRNWVTDVWGAATAGSNAEAVLQAGSEPATNVQVILGGPTRVTGTVSALARNYVGSVGDFDTKTLIFKDSGGVWTP